MRFSFSSLHALLEMKCDMQISYEMVSNAHVHQLCVPLSVVVKKMMTKRDATLLFYRVCPFTVFSPSNDNNF